MHNTTFDVTQPPRGWARGLRLAAALTAGVALLTGCATASPSSDEPSGGERIAASLTALFDQYLARDDLSDFEREVLERASQNGQIAAQDYELSHAQEAACVEDAGYDVTYEKLPNGLYKATPHLPEVSSQDARDTQADQYMQTTARCAQGVNMVIEALWSLQQGNPDLLADPDEAAVQCLRKAGLVPGDYTADAFREQFGEGFNAAPFDPGTDAAQACLLGNGMAVAVAPEAGS